MIRILHAADLHLGARFRGLRPEKGAALRRAQRALLEAMVDLADGCDLVLLAGDLFDRPQGDGESVRALKAALAAMKLPVFIAPGNHDYISTESPYIRETWPENVHIFRRDRLESVALPELSCRVWGAGYTAMDCPALLEGFRARGEERYQLMVLHGDPESSASPCCPVTKVQAAASGLRYLALGHVHKAGSFRAGQTLCAWPGCAMGRGFDETGEKGVYLTCLEDPEDRVCLTPVTAFRYLDLEAPGDNPEDGLMVQLPPNTAQAVCRVTYTGPADPLDLEVLHDRLKDHFFDLQLRDRTEPPLELWKSAGEDTLEGNYFRLLREAAEANPQNKEVLNLAARLSRMILDGREVELP